MPVNTKTFALLGLLILIMPLLAFIQTADKGNGSETSPVQMISADSALSAVKIEQSTLSVDNPDPAISICSQHAPKCPLTAAGWPGEPDGWQYTGKKWIWVPGTPNKFNRTVVWEYSQPYSGSNPDYFGQREDHYASCSNNPEDCSFFSGTPPETYDWERWLQEGDNYRVMQLGNEDEQQAYLLGETDCNSGIFYPVVDHQTPYFFTPMYTNRWGECTGGGYVAAYLSEQWGEPLSHKRMALCDNPTNGVPTALSTAGNTICKISPHVGVVYQRYIFGAKTPADVPSVGCEAVLYAWGWTEPQSPASGQQYQTWFRNGELRFTRWYDLSDQVSVGNIPNPYDHAWWDSRCQAAWTSEGNWLYSGTFRVGNAEYRDQAALPAPTVIEIPASGGELTVADGGTVYTYTFPAGVFTETVQITHFYPEQAELPPAGGRFTISPAYYIFAEYLDDHKPAQPAAPYTVTTTYPDNLSASVEESLALYAWDGYQWLREPSSSVDVDNNTLVATSNHFSLWAVMVDGRRVYLPHVLTDLTGF